MKLIICGSRTIVPTPKDFATARTLHNHRPGIQWVSPYIMFQVIDAAIGLYFFGETITEVVSGRADGGDHFGEMWALRNNVTITPFPVTPEEWRLFGRVGPMGAGHRRNRPLAQKPMLTPAE